MKFTNPVNCLDGAERNSLLQVSVAHMPTGAAKYSYLQCRSVAQTCANFSERNPRNPQWAIESTGAFREKPALQIFRQTLTKTLFLLDIIKIFCTGTGKF